MSRSAISAHGRHWSRLPKSAGDGKPDDQTDHCRYQGDVQDEADEFDRNEGHCSENQCGGNFEGAHLLVFPGGCLKCNLQEFKEFRPAPQRISQAGADCAWPLV